MLVNDVVGWRLNNPCHVEKGSSKWKGLCADQPHRRFCSFVSPEYGIRAAAYLLKISYQQRLGLTTVRQLISRYAPASENDVEAYVWHVAGEMTVPPDSQVDLTNFYLLHAMLSGMIAHEMGFNPYSNELIERGIKLL